MLRLGTESENCSERAIMKKISLLLYILCLCMLLVSCGKNKKAEERGKESESPEAETVQETEGAAEEADSSDHVLRYSIGSKNRVKKAGGYVGTKEITSDDPHYGWELGQFFISGYTTNTNDADGNLVFLKNTGDQITLWFNLEQDINCLNGKEELTIEQDEDGFDQYFETEKTDFGRGALIIRYTDHENVKHAPVIYTDYLSASAETGADTVVQTFEEGDYEVALDYQIKNDKRKVWGKSVLPEYGFYRTFFRFSVRNGNCMVYPFDAVTGSELSNSSITPNGFYLDLAKSRYLKINIKKEVLKEGADGLTEDTRFNRPAKDGEKYTEEGVYTITVRNAYTDQKTTKKIYVGTDKLLIAHVNTGLSVGEIKKQVEEGARITEDGRILAPGEKDEKEEKKGWWPF